MPVYLPTAVVGNKQTLLTLGLAGEIMGWFYPSKDHAQNIYQCMPCVYLGEPPLGKLWWTWGGEWEKQQQYIEDSNVCVTTLRSASLQLELEITDLVPEEGASLIRTIRVTNLSANGATATIFHFGDWNMGGIRTGNGVYFNHELRALVQSGRDVTAVIGGDALETWQCGKAGTNWHNNALFDLEDGILSCQDLEIGDVNWAFGFKVHLQPGEQVQRTALFTLAGTAEEAAASWRSATATSPASHLQDCKERDAAWLAPALHTLESVLHASHSSAPPAPPQFPRADVPPHLPILPSSPTPTPTLPDDILSAYKRSILCLPLLCGPEGAAIAAPEFDSEFVSCGGYGYLWPRDGGEYVSGLMDAGYGLFAGQFFDWCARHQDPSGLWHQRYFLNGQPGPNWCLPPDMLQIDQVGAVLWAFGKWTDWKASAGLDVKTSDPAVPRGASENTEAYHTMIRKAADYLLSRLTGQGVHANAFDTWESFIGSFTYSNAALYAAFRTAARVLGDAKYEVAAKRVKDGVLDHFVLDNSLRRGFDSAGQPDWKIDSSALGAIEPFSLLDLQDEKDLALAEGTLQAISQQLEVDWEGGRAIRRFEGDAYVGGVPACVNTLWMARCCCKVADRIHEQGRRSEARDLTERASVYLSTVLRRSTPTGLLPELMQGPTGQRYWAAPHGWAMSSFVSGALMLAKRLAEASPIASGDE